MRRAASLCAAALARRPAWGPASAAARTLSVSAELQTVVTPPKRRNRDLPAKRHNYDPNPDLLVPWEERRPFAQKNRRRDDVLMPRLPPAVPTMQSATLEAWLSTWDSAHAGIIRLRADVWGMPLRPDIVHRVVFWQRACLRVGLAKTRGRSEVRGGGRKPRPQKGTGKSRQGSIRAPQWKGGARAFPKRQRSYKYFLPRKVQTLGLKVALSDKYRRGALVVLEDLSVETHKTSELVRRMWGLGIDTDKHRVMMLTMANENHPSIPHSSMRPVVKAARNVRKISTQTAHDCNVFDLVRHHLLVVDQKSLAELEARFDDLIGNGHVHQQDQPKLPFAVRTVHSPRGRLSGGRIKHKPRVVTLD
ncbi:hypothetical protein AB1Y20_009847 [Prymnesium parvum]|uniref:Large ribosomal subunit protein uL4m n=1 Tax=Prymnesium parvum TaxID=97485 RepID=A0AB34K7Q4_PRYPA